MRLAFLASNNGSAMRAIVAAIAAGTLAAEAVILVSNRAASPALEFAAAHGMKAVLVPTKDNPDAADARLCDLLTDEKIDLVILSGYLRKLGPRTLAVFENRLLNTHPALLPKHGGQGMYGRRVHEAVVAAGDTETGATIHLVDGEYDHGRIIAQARLPVTPGMDVDAVEQAVLAAEKDLFVETLRRIVAGDLRL
jgi:phosphoribosylglycinamide formyltransferase-1